MDFAKDLARKRADGGRRLDLVSFTQQSALGQSIRPNWADLLWRGHPTCSAAEPGRDFTPWELRFPCEAQAARHGARILSHVLTGVAAYTGPCAKHRRWYSAPSLYSVRSLMPIYTPHAGHDPCRCLPTGLCQRALRSSIRTPLPSRSQRPSVVPPTISGLSMGRLRGGSCGCSSTGGLRVRVLGRGENHEKGEEALETPQAGRCSVPQSADMSFAASRVGTTRRARRCMQRLLSCCDR
jgi:hypothetical protein